MIAVSITPAHVITAVTSPAPAAIEYVETLRAPEISFARLAEIEPAAMIMPASRKTLLQRGAFNSSTSTEPTTTICTIPRSKATAVSLSR